MLFSVVLAKASNTNRFDMILFYFLFTKNKNDHYNIDSQESALNVVAVVVMK